MSPNKHRNLIIVQSLRAAPPGRSASARTSNWQNPGGLSRVSCYGGIKTSFPAIPKRERAGKMVCCRRQAVEAPEIVEGAAKTAFKKVGGKTVRRVEANMEAWNKENQPGFPNSWRSLLLGFGCFRVFPWVLFWVFCGLFVGFAGFWPLFCLWASLGLSGCCLGFGSFWEKEPPPRPPGGVVVWRFGVPWVGRISPPERQRVHRQRVWSPSRGGGVVGNVWSLACGHPHRWRAPHALGLTETRLF